MKNKFMRSVTAMVVAVTMLISSQGVVTSFADGGDYSDRSESSSVQMNEVGNNGTDQSTKDDAAQCNCEATDGEAHKESCPLYVKPDGGNTNDGDTEDDAAQCTCGAEEGGPHKEGCPLYVKPDGGNTSDGDTDNGAGEDADIKSVVDDINALLAAGTITEETDLEVLKTQVNAARAAYNALSEEQKAAFDTATLEKLTALEAKISELESMEANITYIMQAVNTLPEGEPVAMIGDKGYKTLDAAIAAAGDGDTIAVLQDCTTQNGFSIFGKSLTIDGNNHAITVDKLGIYLLNNGSNIAELTFKNCRQLNIIPVSGAPTTVGNTAGWGSVIVSFNCILTFDNCTVNIQQPIDDTKVDTAFYSHTGAKINIQNGSTVNVTGFKSLGFGMDPHDTTEAYTSEINILNNSNLSISNCTSGIFSTYQVTVDMSTLSICGNRQQGSDGNVHINTPDYFIKNDSTVTASGNGTFGLYTRTMHITGKSTVTCENNGYSGITASDFFVESGSTVILKGNSSAPKAGASIQLKYSQQLKESKALVEEGATFQVTNNHKNGIDIFGNPFNVEIRSGEITYNGINDGADTGGGIYIAKQQVILSDNVQIYNNHAKKSGDDIYLDSDSASITFSKVGTDWILDDTNLPITGWYFDGNNNGATTNRWSKSNYYELFNLFDENGKVTLTGTYALKAAHAYAYAYDPETPVNPTDWEHSKSKTATNLDANYQSQVTLSLPAAQEQLVSDVVFVLDKSTSGNVKDDAIKMLESLKSDIEENGAKVNVGIVIFNQAASRFGWYDLITEYDQIIEIFNKEIKDGTNLNAGLLAAKEMLEEHTDVDPNRKHMILVSDGISYYYCEGTNYQQGYTIASLNGGDDGEGTRNCTPDSTLSAWGIKYGTYGADNEGFSYIPDWSQWESGMPALLSSDYTKYQYQVGSPDIPTEAD